jgi:hypothetical protein
MIATLLSLPRAQFHETVGHAIGTRIHLRKSLRAFGKLQEGAIAIALGRGAQQ